MTQQDLPPAWCLSELSPEGALSLLRGAGTRSYNFQNAAIAKQHGVRAHWRRYALVRLDFVGPSKKARETICEIFENAQPAALSGNDTNEGSNT